MLVSNKAIPIVMSADNNYFVPLAVSILSILLNRSDSTNYTFYILTPDDFRDEYITVINKILKDNKLNDAFFISMGNCYINSHLSINHTSIPTYYRLSLPELIKEDRCIYLDSDTLILNDLSVLMEIATDNNLLHGVRAAGYNWPIRYVKEKAAKLHINDLDTYINAGVLVMNLELMRANNISSIFQKLLKEKWESQDQDILNSACYGRIAVLPPKYNSMTKYQNNNFESYNSPMHPYLRLCYTSDQWREACENPVIIHFADEIKPWDSLSTPFSYLWWKYLRFLDKDYPCYDECFKKLTEKEKISINDVRLQKAIQDLDSINNSLSFKIGRFITFPVRKLKNIMQRDVRK